MEGVPLVEGQLQPALGPHRLQLLFQCLHPEKLAAVAAVAAVAAWFSGLEAGQPVRTIMTFMSYSYRESQQ